MEGLQLRRKREPSILLEIHQRLDAEMIACQEQALATGIRDRERKHAAQVRHASITPLLVRMHDDFRIRLRTEAMTALLERTPEFAIVVDLAVEGDPDVAILVREWLRSGLDIDD